MNPIITILMPLHNATQYIDDCIESIVKQSFEKWELIIVDDFSTDDTVNFVKKWILNDSRISYFKNEKKGIIPALSTAFNKSKGKYITRMDGDDLMPENKLELFYNEIKKEQGLIVVTGKVKYFSEEKVSEGYLRYEKWLNEQVDRGTHWKNIYRECVIASPNWMVSRMCFEKIFALTDLVYPEDYDMAFKWYQNNIKILSLDHITHLWREHQNRTSRKDLAYQQEAFFNLKTNQFIINELNESEKIQLIGAGVKGKQVASILLEQSIEFDWFDLNAKTYNTKLLNHEILPVNDLNSSLKTILTVWPLSLEKQSEILQFMNGRGFFFGENCWLF